MSGILEAEHEERFQRVLPLEALTELWFSEHSECEEEEADNLMWSYEGATTFTLSDEGGWVEQATESLQE